MADPQAITADALEILVTRELRRAGIEPIALQRHRLHRDGPDFQFELAGRLQAYGHAWSAFIGCLNRAAPIEAADLEDLRLRADQNRTASALLCTTAEITDAAVSRAGELRVPLLQVVDAQLQLTASGAILPGQLPAWLPEYALQLVSRTHAGQLLEPNEPELILRELRAARPPS